MIQSERKPFIAFCRAFVAYAPKRVALTLSLTLLLGLLQGVGILLLVPLLAALGMPANRADGFPGAVARLFFETLHVPRSLVAILGIYVSLVALRAFIDQQRTLLDAQLQLGFARELRARVYNALLFAEWRFLSGIQRSDFIQVLTHDVQRAGQAVMQALVVVTGSVLLIVFLSMSFAVSPFATLITLAVAGLLAWLLRGTLAGARTSGTNLTAHSNELYALVSEHLAGLAEIRSYGAESSSATSLANVTAQLDDTRYRFARFQTASRLWMTIGGAAALAAFILFAVRVMQLPLASLMLLVYLFGRILPQTQQLHNTILQLVHTLPAFESVQTLLRTVQHAAEPNVEATAPNFERSVIFDDVSFAHRPPQPTLSKVSFEIQAHQSTAIVGPSGAGKTTIAELLMGMLLPDQGRILIDGTELRSEARRAWRKRIGFVPQETFLLHDTIRANLLLARPLASDDEIWEALTLSDAAEFVRALPQQLDTIVGDRGTQLSGGERQRVALARALLVRPGLLLLDEATSSIDVQSERRIFEALRRLNGHLTIVLITHRLASLDWIDNAVALENGHVVKTGMTAVPA